MAAATMPKTGILTFTLATTLTRVDYLAALTPTVATQDGPAKTLLNTGTFPVGSREIPVTLWITADATDVTLVCDGVSGDGDAVPAADFFLIPAGTTFGFHTRGKPILLAGAAAENVHLLLQ